MSFYHLPTFRRISKNSKTILALLIISGLGVAFLKQKSSSSFNMGAVHSGSSAEDNVEFRASSRHSSGADSGRDTSDNFYSNQPEGFDGDGVSFLKCKEQTSHVEFQKRY